MIDTNGSNLVVLDVREESEYCEDDPDPITDPPPGHISGTLNYPWFSEILQNNSDQLPDDKAILVVCRSGGRSAAAADFLCNQEKFESTPIYNMEGGMLDWEWETVPCCYSDTDCDDGLYCTGDELCVNLDCRPSQGNPCVDQAYFCCHEDAGMCIEQDPHLDYDCDGLEDYDDKCFDKPNGPVSGTCVRTLNSMVVSYREGGSFVTCTEDGDCTGPGTRWCEQTNSDGNENGIGDVCECYGDTNKDGYVSGGDGAMVDNEYGRYDCPTAPPSGSSGIDTDGDGVEDDLDNCPDHPNGEIVGTCVRTLNSMVVSYRIGGSFVTCMDDGDCTGPGTKWCEQTNSDGDGNGIGDVCECYGDTNRDGYVLGGDSALIDSEYSRSDCPVFP